MDQSHEILYSTHLFRGRHDAVFQDMNKLLYSCVKKGSYTEHWDLFLELRGNVRNRICVLWGEILALQIRPCMLAYTNLVFMPLLGSYIKAQSISLNIHLWS